MNTSALCRPGFLAVALLAISAQLAQASDWMDATKAKVDASVERHFSNRSQVGVVVGVIKGEESAVWSYGERVLGSGELPTGDTFFEMGSITKTFTATLLALEVTRGRVSLDTQVKALWPDLKGTDAGEITLEQLATHTSGLPRMPDNFAPIDPLNPYKDYDRALLAGYLKSFKQKRPGPYGYDYSNVGLGLLGDLLAHHLNGKSFGDYLRTELLQPLGLADTFTALEASQMVRAAQGYDGFFNPMPFWDLNVMDGAGVLKTTANDLLKYVSFNLNPGSGELGRAAELAQAPRFDLDAHGTRIGLAWHLMPLGKYSVITHSGATGGYRANLIFDREKGIGAISLSNTAVAPVCVLAPVFEEECEVPEWAVIAPEKQEKLLGTYRSEQLAMNIEVFFENGLLGIQPDNQPKLRLWATSELEYHYPDAGARFVFTRNDEGKITSFTLHQGGTFEFSKFR